MYCIVLYCIVLYCIVDHKALISIFERQICFVFRHLAVLILKKFGSFFCFRSVLYVLNTFTGVTKVTEITEITEVKEVMIKIQVT